MNEDSLEKLVREVVDEWDMDTLISNAHDNLAEYYRKNPKEAIEEMIDRDIDEETFTRT